MYGKISVLFKYIYAESLEVPSATRHQKASSSNRISVCRHRAELHMCFVKKTGPGLGLKHFEKNVKKLVS
jgi:hypothetical protein